MTTRPRPREARAPRAAAAAARSRHVAPTGWPRQAPKRTALGTTAPPGPPRSAPRRAAPLGRLPRAQLWRISDLLYLPEEQVVQELEAHREWILTGREPGSGKPRSKPAAGAAKREAAGAGAAQATGQAVEVKREPTSEAGVAAMDTDAAAE